MIRRRLLDTTLSVARRARARAKRHINDPQATMSRTADRLLSGRAGDFARASVRGMRARLRSGITVTPRETLTQAEIEAVARETNLTSPWIEHMPLPSFEQLAAQTREACVCHHGLRQRRTQQEVSQTERAEQVCRLLGAMGDRFGSAPKMTALIEELLLAKQTSPCVQQVAADLLAGTMGHQSTKERVVRQLRRRAEWDGKTPERSMLIERLS